MKTFEACLGVARGKQAGVLNACLGLYNPGIFIYSRVESNGGLNGGGGGGSRPFRCRGEAGSVEVMALRES